MKPEYQLTISRTDRIYLLLLVCLLLGWELIKYIVPDTILAHTSASINQTEISIYKQKSYPGHHNYSTEISKSSIITHDSSNAASPPLPEEHRKPVKIMEASQKELQAIGLSQQVAKNIVKYREAGGQLKNETDALRIYGMDTAQWTKISPYILFPQKQEITKSDNTFIPNRYLPKRILDLNTVNVTDLDSLPGIGPVFAERIIELRTSLGGFLQVEQIKTCHGIPPETIEKILPLVRIEVPAQPQDVNKIDWNTFQHPYLKKKFSTMIMAYKKNHGPFSTPDDFRKVFPPDTNWCDALLPYLYFSQEK